MGSSPNFSAPRLAAQTLQPWWAPHSALLSLPLTWLLITTGFCKAPINHLHSEPKTRQGRRMQLKGSSAQLSFLSRQPSPKITSSRSIHLPAERAPLRPDPMAFAITKDLAFWSWMKLQGLALAQPVPELDTASALGKR